MTYKLYKKLPKEGIVEACKKAWEQTGGGRMLLAVSGGPDSTALMLAFMKAGIPFEAAHCNFNLRADESLRDQEFVKKFCQNHGIIFNFIEFDTLNEVGKGESLEMTCRRLRYDFFRSLTQSKGFDRIVIGHNADDNLETFFLNALRGSGTRGLKGMDKDTGELLRPLLGFSRREIIDFLDRNGQGYIIDSSNLQSDNFRRNFLRNRIFPLLESKWEGFSKALTSTIELQKRENAIVEYFTQKSLEGISDFLPWYIIFEFPDYETIIYRFISPFGGTPVIAKEMAESSKSLIPGKIWRFNDVIAIFTKQGIRIKKKCSEPSPLPSTDYEWEKIDLDETRIETIKKSSLDEIYLPNSASHYQWILASREMRIKSLGLMGSQQVWKVLKDAGISSSERKNFALLADKETGEPIWIPGIKRSGLHLISDGCKYAYHVKKKF